MTDRGLSEVTTQLRALFALGVVGELSDEQLLGRFLGGRGEAAESAFAELVRRHGPMVLGACRRVLGDRTRRRTPSRRPSWCSPARPARSPTAGPSSAGSSGSPTARPDGPATGPIAAGPGRSTRSPSRPPSRRRRAVPNSARRSTTSWRGSPSGSGCRWSSANFRGSRDREAARRLRLPEGTLSSRLRPGPRSPPRSALPARAGPGRGDRRGPPGGPLLGDRAGPARDRDRDGRDPVRGRSVPGRRPPGGGPHPGGWSPQGHDALEDQDRRARGLGPARDGHGRARAIRRRLRRPVPIRPGHNPPRTRTGPRRSTSSRGDPPRTRTGSSSSTRSSTASWR